MSVRCVLNVRDPKHEIRVIGLFKDQQGWVFLFKDSGLDNLIILLMSF